MHLVYLFTVYGEGSQKLLTNPRGWPLQIYSHPAPFSNLLLFLEELFSDHNPIGMLTEKDETLCQRRSQSAHILLFHKILK
jgi:hypothetical protein